MITSNPQKRTFRLSASIGSALLLAMLSCRFLSLNTESPPINSTPYPDINPHEILQITPRPDNQTCWNPELEGFASGTWEEAKKNIPIASGMGGGMGEGDFSNSSLIGWSTFNVKSATALTGTFHWLSPEASQNSETTPLRFLVILDEIQLVGAIEGSSNEYYYDIIMEAGDEITLTLNIPPLTPGVHDLIVTSMIRHELNPYGSVKLAVNRYSLLAGSVPEIIPRSFQPLPKQGSIAKNDPTLSLDLSLTSEYPFVVWNWPDNYLAVSVGEATPFYIFTEYSVIESDPLSNLPAPEEIPFALLTFLDDRQIDFSSGIPVFYGSVLQDTAYTTINTSLRPIQELGRHELLVLRINYPGLPMCLLHGPSDGYLFNYFSDASRVGIEVVPVP